MKVLFTDSSIKGHHVPYLLALIDQVEEYLVVIPETISDIPLDHQIIVRENCKEVSGYFRWIKRIQSIAVDNNVDLIHYLYGDIFFRFFGLGINKNIPSICTFHHFRKGTLRDISLKHIFSRISMGIVHTEALLEYAGKRRISNCELITYPVFEEIKVIETRAAKEQLSISEGDVCFLCFGGTRYDKGLDIFLEAIKLVDRGIHVIIAGNPEYFSEEFVYRHIEDFKGGKTLVLRFIDEDEMSVLFSACDFIVLPYRRIFDGASGPLGIGCTFCKGIIGPNHGSLGRIINDNHLGYTFESENINSLADVLNKATKEGFSWTENAQMFADGLNVKLFKQRYMEKYASVVKRIK